MTYDCDNCAMEFDTTGELANHKAKFCVSSKYGSQDALDKRMEELKRLEHVIDHTNYNYNQKSKPAGPSSMKSAGMGVIGLKNDQRLPSPYRHEGEEQQAQIIGSRKPSNLLEANNPSYSNSRKPSAGHDPGLQINPNLPQNQLPPRSGRSAASGLNYNEPLQPTTQQPYAQKPPKYQSKIPEQTPFFYGEQQQQYPAPYGANKDMYMLDQMRRMEDDLRRQEDRFIRERETADQQRLRLNSELAKLRRAQEVNRFDQSLDINKVIPQSNDQDILKKLADIEGYSNMQARYNNLQPLIQEKPSHPQPPVGMPQSEYTQWNYLQYPSNNKMLDELERAYKLRQDVKRCEDQETEEKAMTSLAAQEYDALKILSTIPEHSELYKFKFDQYKKLSEARAKAEVVLQEQRLKRIVSNFAYQNQDIDRKVAHDSWIEEQKRRMLVQKLVDLGDDAKILSQPPKVVPISVANGSLLNSGNYLEYKPTQEIHTSTIHSVSVYLDTLFQAPREWRDIELCFTLTKNGAAVKEFKPRIIRMKNLIPDFEQPMKSRCSFNYSSLLTDLFAPLNIIIEVRASDPTSQHLHSVGWTIMPVHNPSKQVNYGRWRLPCYTVPTKTDTDVRQIPALQHLNDMQLCIRLGLPSDDAQINFDPESASAKGYYDLAPYHKEFRAAPQTPMQTVSDVKSTKSNRSRPLQTDESMRTPEQTFRPKKLDLEMKRDPNYTNRGIKVVCHFARLNLKPNNVYFQATLYHGKEIIDIGADSCNWLSSEVDKTEVIDVDQSSKIKVTKDGILVNKDSFRDNQTRPVQFVFPSNESVIWETDLYELVWQKKLTEKLILLIQVSTRNLGGDLEIVGYVVKDLTMNDGKIIYGTFEENLLKQPIQFKFGLNNTSQRSTSTIQFTVMPPGEERLDTSQFIPNQERQYTVRDFWKEDEEDGFDIYIDSAFGLPDNVSIVKVIAKVVNNRGEVQLGPTPLWPQVEPSSFQKQHYKAKLELRGQDSDPTSMLHLTFITLETTTLKEKIVGFSVFPIFINSVTKMPVLEKNNRNDLKEMPRALHKGAYQLPIYCEFPDETGLITYENYFPLERIPTASVLLRIAYSSIDYEGNFISIKDPNPTIRDLAYEQMPDFNSGAYSTVYYISSLAERELYTIRKQRKIDVPLFEVMDAIVKVMKVKTSTKEGMLDYFGKVLGSGAKDVGMLDLSFFSAYTPSQGFRMNLEAVHGCNLKDSVLYAIACVNPPASPYNKNDRSMVGALSIMQTNWNEATSRHFTFAEDDTAFGNILLFNSSVIIFDIKQYNYRTKLTSDFGYAVYPVSQMFQERLYIISGVMILPIYEGKVSSGLIEAFKSNPDKPSSQIISELIGKKVIQYAKEPVMAIVKVVDNQRSAHYLRKLSEFTPSKRFLSLEQRKSYVYASQARQGQLIEESIAESDKEEIQEAVAKSLLNSLKNI